MVEPALLIASVLGAAVVVSDDRLIRLNRKMPIADFEEVNLVARRLTEWLGEDAGWTALQGCGIVAFAAMMMFAFLYPWIEWAVVGVLSAGLAVVLFDLFHDGREMRLALASGYGLAMRRSTD